MAVFDNGLDASPAYLQAHGEPMLPDALASMHRLMISGRSGESMAGRLSRGEDEGEAAEQWTDIPTQRTLDNAPDLLLRIACAGVGVSVGIVSDHFAQVYADRGELLRALPDWKLPPAPCREVFPERHLMPLRTGGFIDAMAAASAPCTAQEAQA